MSLNPATLAPGKEQWELYPDSCRKGKNLCQYDYRHTDGTLFSCVARSLDLARTKRYMWVADLEERVNA